MELRRLRLLAELRRTGTIAGVAEVLGYSPSSVSVQLGQLEREAGTSLLARVGRNVQLTPAGHRLAEHAEHALALDERVRGELTALSAGRAVGTVRVSCVQTAALALLPKVMALLAGTAPELRLELIHSETKPALVELRARRIDLAVGIDYPPVPPPRYAELDRIDLLEEDVLLAVPSRSSFTRVPTVRIEDLKHVAWAAGPPGEGHRAVIEYLCNRIGGFTPDVRHRTDDALILRALVSSGHAVTLLPALIGTATPHVSLRPLEGVHLTRVIFTAARTSSRHSVGIQAVRTALAEVAGEVTQGREDARVPKGDGANAPLAGEPLPPS